MKDNLRMRTRMVHAGSRRSGYGETSEALFLTQGFLYPDAETAAGQISGYWNPDYPEDSFTYARSGSPTTAMFQDRIAALEGAEAAFATASGMAAVHAALMSQLAVGDHVVAARALFGSSLYLLDTLCARFGIETTWVDGPDLDQWRAAFRENTKLAMIETPANPTLELIDIAAVAEIAREAGARVIVDNVFATPLFQHPLELGADIVVYSATKHIDGQGRCLGGVILGSKAFIEEELAPYVLHTGPTMSPFTSWVMLKSLETFPLRVNAQADSAELIANRVEGNSKLERLLYPGLTSHPQHELAKRQMERPGTMIALEIKGGQEGAFRFLIALQVIGISNNVGDTKSLATHPVTTTHQRLGEEYCATIGITPGMVRLSVGLEDPEDLIADIEQALKQV